MELTREEQYLSYLAGEGTELPNPITRKEQFLRKIANKKTTWDDLEGKPFYDEEVRTVLVPETTVEFTTNKVSLTSTADFRTANLVIFDGVEYDVVWDAANNSLGDSKLQSSSGDSTPNAPPFSFYQLGSGFMHSVYVHKDNLGTHTFAVYKVEGSIKTIDEKYLPESVDGVVIRSSTADSTKKFKLTVDDSGTISVTEVTA